MQTVELVQDRIEIKTLGDFLSQNGGLLSGFSVQEVVSFENNKERIFAKYTGSISESEIAKFNALSGPALATLPLLIGTKLILPVDKINREYFELYFDGEPIVNTTSIQSFVASKLIELSSNPLYSKIVKSKNKEILFKDSYPDHSVIVWSRILNKFINISSFVTNCVTNNSQNGGNFIVTLPPLQAINIDGSWGIDTSAIKKVKRGDNIGYECTFNLFENGKRQKSFFDYVIQKNDIVFIQFETLEIEKDKRKKNASLFEVCDDNIKDGIFDMIGLVDDVGFQYASENNDYTITLVGRDMMKVLIEDGTYFFPLEFGGANVFQNVSETERENSSFIKRSLVSGKLISLSAYTNKTVDFALSFVIERLSNIGIIPDEGALSAYQSNKKGIWKLIEFLVDDSVNVSRRRLVDSSIAQEQGALLNYVRKIVQEPFLEFYGDTYGDKYFFITRQPPFDKEGFNSLLNGSVRSEISKGEIVINNLGNKNVIDVESSDVIKENIDWDSSQVYSWYRVVPKAVYLGAGSNITLAFIPAVFFQEYVDIFGAKPYEQVYNYSTFDGTVDPKQEYRYSYTQEQVYRDLKFVIESNCYLPFTRSGTLIINGDRRIKKGTLIRYKATGEIFYVNRVTNNITFAENSVDRYTLLEVSRGMIEKYIEGVEMDFVKDGNVVQKLVSYFSIINMPIETSNFIQNSGKKINTKIVADWKVDKDIFEFFLKRKQWS